MLLITSTTLSLLGALNYYRWEHYIATDESTVTTTKSTILLPLKVLHYHCRKRCIATAGSTILLLLETLLLLGEHCYY